MRFSVLTFGTRGDVQPYIALGKRLVARGHQVQIVTHTNFESFVKQHGLEFLAIGGDATRLIRDLMRTGRDPIAFIRAWRAFFDPMMDEAMEAFWRGTQDADAYLYNPFGFFAYHVAEKRGVPCFRTALWPFERTAAAPMFMLAPPVPLGGGYNRLSYRLYDQVAQFSIRTAFNGWRRKHGLPEHRPFEYPYNRLNGRPVPALFAYSEALVPRPADWGDHVHITGFWPLEAPDDWTPPDDLLRFLEAGDPPVYIGFGSLSGNPNYPMLVRSAIEALCRTGQRGLLVSAWGDLQGIDLPPHIFALDSAPHDWLFPRMKAVVHHGGVGTTAAGLRAGCPTVICPFFGDQPFWGERVAALGVGSPPVPQQTLTVDRLAAAIHQVTADRRIREKAQRLAERLCEEDGLGRAVAVLEAPV